jgi:hypothetical protein
MSDKQQTTVDWIEQEMLKGNLSLKQILIQAREMEKERMIEFGELCWKNLLRSDVIMRPRDVYNETYGGDDE